MHCDNENTNPVTEERSPFLDAYLKFDQQVFASIKQRDGLMCILGAPKLDHKKTLEHAERIITAWEAAERAAELMAETKQHLEQALTAQATVLLDQNGELTADVLERAAYRLANDDLLTRAGQLRERALSRRTIASCDRAGQRRVPS